MSLAWISDEDIAEARAVGLRWATSLQSNAQPLASHSTLNRRGGGADWLGTRPMEPGDDLRSVDWRASARSGSTLVRQHLEERASEWLLLLDQRPAMQIGAGGRVKSAQAIRIAIALSEAAASLGTTVNACRWRSTEIEIMDAALAARPESRLVWLSQRPAAWWEQPLPHRSHLSEPRTEDLTRQSGRIGSSNAVVWLLSDIHGLSQIADSSPCLRELTIGGPLRLVRIQDSTDWSPSTPILAPMMSLGVQLRGGERPEGVDARVLMREGRLDPQAQQVLDRAERDAESRLQAVCEGNGVRVQTLSSEDHDLFSILSRFEITFTLLAR